MTWPKIAVPAYIHPAAYAGDWDALLACDPATVPLVVANVADGPGEQRDDGWAAVMARARRQGIAVLGYVDTGYLGGAGAGQQERPAIDWLAAVQRDVSTWYALYGGDLGGIFFDRVRPAAEAAPTYRRLGQDVKGRHPGAVTALNPGGVVPVDFAPVADVLVTFEGTFDRYRQSGPPGGELDWSPADPAGIWHLVYDVPGDRLDEVLDRSRRRHAGLLYVTEQSVPNPWGRLARYWDHLVAGVTPADAAGNRPGDPSHPA